MPSASPRPRDIFSARRMERAPCAEIVVGGLLEPRRLQRLAVLSRAGHPSPLAGERSLCSGDDCIFRRGQKTAAERDLAGVVQTEVAERLMILAANSEATPEVRAAALAGVHEVQGVVKKSATRGPVAEQTRSRDHSVPAESGAEHAEAEIVRRAARAAGLALACVGRAPSPAALDVGSVVVLGVRRPSSD